MPQSRRSLRAVTAAAALLAGFAALLLLASLISREFLATLLARQYGAAAVDRHFPPALYAAWLVRERVTALLLLAASAALFWLREPSAHAARAVCTALQLSFAHAWRCRDAWSFFSSPEAAMLLMILDAAAAIRVKFLALPMRLDESTTFLSYASKPLYIGLSVYPEPNNQVFHTLLVHFSTAVFGPSPWAIRLPAFLAGVLLPALIFFLLRAMGKSEAGLLAAALTACASAMVEYSANGRGYTIISCCAALVFWSGYECAMRARPVWFLVLAVAAVLGLYTVPVMLFALVAALAWMLWLARDARRHRRAALHRRLATTLIAVGAGGTALYLPVLLVSGPRALFQNGYLQPLDFPWYIKGNLVCFAETWQVWNRDLPPGARLVLSVAAVLALAMPSLGGPLRSLGIATLFSALLLLAAGRFVPQVRIWLMFLPLYLVLAACAFTSAARLFSGRRARRGFLYVFTALWVALASWRVTVSKSIPESTDTGSFLGGPEIAEYLDRHQIPLASVIRTGRSDMPLRYYLWRKSRRLQPSVARLELSGKSSAWCVANEQFGETPATVLGEVGLTPVRVVESVKFRRAGLYRVQFQ